MPDRHEPPATDGAAAIERVRQLHRKASHGDVCVTCSPLQRLGYDVTWPCSTILALEDRLR